MSSEESKVDQQYNADLGSIYHTPKEETMTPISASIKGVIPSWLKGSLLRVGSNMFEVGKDKYNHWFDGLALLLRFNISDGDVTFQSQYLRSETYKKSLEANRIIVTEAGTRASPDPCKSIFRKIFSYFIDDDGDSQSDNNAISWVQIGEDFYVYGEGTQIMKADKDSLNDMNQKFDISQYFALHTSTAHPHTAENGDLYNMGSNFAFNSSYKIVKIPKPSPGTDDPLKDASLVCSFPVSQFHPSYYHSFGMSENYFVFVEQSLVINLLKLQFRNMTDKSVLDCFEYRGDQPARFYVVKRDTGEVLPIKYTTIPFFMFHHINTYEEDGHIIADVSGYKDGDVFPDLYLEPLRKGIVPRGPQPWRFVLPLSIDKKAALGTECVKLEGMTASAVKKGNNSVYCMYEPLIDYELELPRMNYDHYNTKPYRYAYGMGRFFQDLVKMDAKEKTHKLWHEEHCFASEPIFVPAPDAKEEDEGVVLSAVTTSQESKQAFLLVLDAQTFTEIARAEVPTEIPVSVHGMFAPNKE